MPRARGAVGRLRRGRGSGPRPPGGAARGVPCHRHAPRRPELPRRAEHRRGRGVERDVRAGRAHAGRRRVRVPERRVRDRGRRRGDAQRGLGLSSFVSTGNKADLSGNDFLRFWEDDAGHRGHRPLPRVVRQPAPLRPDRPPRRRPQAGDRGQERSLGRRERAPRPRTPAHCSPRPTPPSTRCSATPA